MKIRRQALLDFYDRKQSWSSATGSPVSAVTGIVGEDVVLGLLCRHLDGQILSYECKPAGLAGGRLDAWVAGGGQLYQVEVKNWCSHSLGGRPISPDDVNLREVAEANLQEFLRHTRNRESIWKVLGAMKAVKNSDNSDSVPLLALWAPVAIPAPEADGRLPFWFDCPLSEYLDVLPPQHVNTTQRTLHIFSASLYLRSLLDEVIELPMPRAEARLRQLAALIEI